MLSTMKREVADLVRLFTGAGSMTATLGLPKKDKRSLRVSDIKALYQEPAQLPALLDFHRYLAAHQCFVSSDARVYGVVFEVGLLPTIGRTPAFALTKRDQIAAALRHIPQYPANPYVLQTYAEDAPITDFIDTIKTYQSWFGVADAYRDDYQRMWGEHLAKLSRPGGYFKQVKQSTSQSRWGGTQRKVRFCLSRDLSTFDKETFDSPAEEIHQVATQVINALKESGAAVTRYDPADVYAWLVPWFNPKPEGADSGAMLVRTHPLAYTPGSDFEGLNDRLFKAYPYVDLENRCITFDDQVHSSIVSVDRFNENPKIGTWTHTTTEHGSRSATAIQRLPEGCILCTTTVFTPSYQTEQLLDQVNKHSKGNDDRSVEAKKQIGQSKLALDQNNVLFPSTSFVYFFGNTHQELKRNRSRIIGVLRDLKFDPIALNADLRPLDCYLKYLPFSYRPKYDKTLFRNRLTWDKHIANVLPLYGYSQGSGNPGVVFSNPEGMPFTFDPLNKLDKEQNSFMGILAPPGSGKSALLNQLIAATKATHNPYFVIIDVNGSFKLHHAYFKELGFDAHYLELAPNSELSLPLFEGAIDAYRDAQIKGKVGSDDDQANPLHNDDDERDPMGEMILTAKLMITKGMPQAEDEFRPNDINMLHNAILYAAEQAIEKGQTIVRPEDVMNALWHISETGQMPGHATRTYRQERRDRAADMAEAMADYTTGVKGQFFNRDGAVSWPDCDLLVLDLKMLAKKGYEDILYLTFIGLMNSINTLIAERRGHGRQTVVINDEAHVVNTVKTLALFKRTSIKMWRKEGCWLWDATQNIKDYPDEALDILSVMEWLILLKMPKAEIDALKKFRDISEDEEAMIGNLTTEKGKYVEGMVLSHKVRGAFRSVPPAWYLVLGQTEEDEYAARLALMQEHGMTEIEAAHWIAETVEAQRCGG